MAKVGLEKIHIAKVTENTNSSYKTEMPVPVPGAIEVNLEPTVQEAKLYADNGLYASEDRKSKKAGSRDSDIDWAWLLYFSRKYLGYSEEEFWQLNLRKLHAQMAAINAQGEKDNNQKAFIDQIPGF